MGWSVQTNDNEVEERDDRFGATIDGGKDANGRGGRNCIGSGIGIGRYGFKGAWFFTAATGPGPSAETTVAVWLTEHDGVRKVKLAVFMSHEWQAEGELRAKAAGSSYVILGICLGMPAILSIMARRRQAILTSSHRFVDRMARGGARGQLSSAKIRSAFGVASFRN